jgi:plastocyanin
MRRLLPLAVLVLPFALTFCDNSDDNNNIIAIGPVVNGNVTIYDDCDSVSFNAAIAPGTCTKAGTTTLSAFNAELTANQSVAAWRFAPTALTVTLGGTIAAFNTGGENHTFTEVANFGGGIVPALNTAAGTPVEAPECAALASNALIAPGATFTTDQADAVGVEHYQCCIHPWMRANVTIVAR